MKWWIILCAIVVIVTGAIFYFQYPKATISVLHQSSLVRVDISSADPTAKLDSPAVVAIMPHHLVGAQLTSETLARVAAARGASVKRVVLLSPNHFKLGNAKVITSRDSWETQDGIVAADTELIEKIIQAGFAKDDFFVTNHDHGVFNIMPFIKKFFPEARVTPLMLSYEVSENESVQLGEFLATQLGPDDLVIVSADFTHYVSESVMSVHDIGTIDALHRLDEHYAQTIMDVDTPQSIVAAMRYAKLRGAEKFILTGRSSSALLLKRNEPPDTTSYVSGVFAGGAQMDAPLLTTTLYIPPTVRNASGLAPLRRGFMHIKDMSEIGHAELFGDVKNVAIGMVQGSNETTYFVYPIEKGSKGDWQLSLFPKNREKLHEFAAQMNATAQQREAIEFERGLSL